ncbi:hypothetical protein pb186bvf_002568 [Paramecium bursaria]
MPYNTLVKVVDIKTYQKMNYSFNPIYTIDGQFDRKFSFIENQCFHFKEKQDLIQSLNHHHLNIHQVRIVLKLSYQTKKFQILFQYINLKYI